MELEGNFFFNNGSILISPWTIYKLNGSPIQGELDLMKVQLIFPNINQGLIAKNVIHPPLGLGYLAAVLLEHGHQVEVIDAAALCLPLDGILTKIKTFKPDLIGITTNITTARMAINTSKYIKHGGIDVPVVFGGPWATIERENILETGLADIIVMGEGEKTIMEIASRMNAGKSLIGVKGMSWRDDSGILHGNPARPHIKNLDDLPFPAWNLFPDSKKYPYNNRHFPYYPVMTSRGCPFNCIYCTKVVHGNKIRYRSVDNVLEEIVHLKRNFHIKELIIADDNFTQDPDRAEQIFDEIIANNLDIKILFSNGIRADIYSERLVAKMKRAGVYRVFLGIESGNQSIVNEIKKGLDLGKIHDFVKLLKEYRIDHYGYFMLGLPNDTYGTMMDTINYAIKLNLKPHFHKTIAFPGTRLFEITKDHLIGEGGARRYSYRRSGATFEMYKGQARDLAKALGLGYLRYFFRLKAIAQVLRDTRSLNDLRWLFNGALHIVDMVMNRA
ncbi:radical SAM protein [Candidatus Bathyarchaeota archaeon]|nr:radical SAM protein [Candidatus Bathyarchaeota archaeon]